MKTKDMVLIAMFAALSAAGAFLKIPMPLCPITLQLLFTTLAGLILGARKGAAAVAVYVAIGLMGIPVFTKGGGPGYVLEPTFGYLLGFIAGAYITGKIAHGGEPTFRRLLAGTISGLVVVYAAGVVYYFFISKVYLGNDVPVGKLLMSLVLIPLPGDILLSVFASELGRRLIPVLEKNNICNAA